MLKEKKEIRDTGIEVPPLIFGSSALGNLYEVPPMAQKRRIVEEWFRAVESPICIDSAGKYGAGLALEEIGKALESLSISPQDTVISNKLGWKRVPLKGEEPQFEPGVWKNISHDAVQAISYDGILSCWEEGNELLGHDFRASLLSVHDPDEYLAAAQSPDARDGRWRQLHGAYRALEELKRDGNAEAIGVGSKDWTTIRELTNSVDLDWVMLAGSLTLYRHTPELLSFVEELNRAGVFVINSAVFNSGFLVGGSYLDYRAVSADTDPAIFAWREQFHEVCRAFGVDPAEACVEFGLAPRGVSAVAMNTTRPERVAANARAVEARAPKEFWDRLLQDHIISVTPEQLR
ncbi:MAG: aldo/keto reductase [Spirochaetaceae bacterium]